MVHTLISKLIIVLGTFTLSLSILYPRIINTINTFCRCSWASLAWSIAFLAFCWISEKYHKISISTNTSIIFCHKIIYRITFCAFSRTLTFFTFKRTYIAFNISSFKISSLACTVFICSFTCCWSNTSRTICLARASCTSSWAFYALFISIQLLFKETCITDTRRSIISWSRKSTIFCASKTLSWIAIKALFTQIIRTWFTNSSIYISIWFAITSTDIVLSRIKFLEKSIFVANRAWRRTVCSKGIW